MSSTRLSLRLADLDLQILALEAHEAIGQPYRIDLRLVAERPDLALDNLLSQPAWLDLGNSRRLHGLVWRAERGETGKRLTHYRIELRPALAWLALRRNSRIFQRRSVPQILTELLSEHGIQGDACHIALSGDYPPRAHCVQYAETDLHFLLRLCEEEGLHFHFQHSESGGVLVFGDDQSVFARLEPAQRYKPEAAEPSIKRLGVRLETRSERVALRDHDFSQPRLLLEVSASSEVEQPVGLELYDYPGRFDDRARGRLRARHLLEAACQDRRQAEGRSDQPLLACGQFVEVQEHPRRDCNQLWLLAAVQHQCYQPQVLEEYAEADPTDADAPPGYHNQFHATPWDVPVRLPARHPRPRVPGMQSAVVVGPENEDIHCDEQGRVQVRFHWERDEQDLNSRVWLRVASGWAGNRYGALVLPRVGMQVLVGFLNSDPDQPLIVGCLRDAEQLPLYPLPEHKTRSLFRTRSTPGGQGGNELRIDDRQGAEQVYLHAQRDWEQHVSHDQTLRIGNASRALVEGNRYSEARGETHRIVQGEALSEVRGDDHLIIGGSQHLTLGDGQFVDAGQEIHLHAGDTLVIEAGSELSIQAGGSFITLDAGGVTLVGAQVKLNAGGSAGKGSPAQPLAPSIPQADTAPASVKHKPPVANTPAPTPSPSQLAVAQTARELGASRCPVCEACAEGSCTP